MNISCKETLKVFRGEVSKKLPGSIQNLALVKLRMIAATTRIDTLRIPPSNHLEKLKGDRKGLYSIRINKRWRITFEWDESNFANNPKIEDYH